LNTVSSFRNVVVMSLAYFLLRGGEQLWNGFLPKYLEALGASALIIGLFGALKDLLDAVYQYPGGALADRVGSQRALLLASALATAGYVVYLAAPGWPVMFLGLFLVMCWESFSLPAAFALIGQSLPKGQRGRGFSLQATMKRLPVMVAPPLGGWLIARFGVLDGVRVGLAASVVLGLAALAAQNRLYRALPVFDTPGGGIAVRYRSWPLELRRLLRADILARIAEGMSEIFAVLYLTNVVGLGALQFGTLVTVQAVAAIIAYTPGGWLADRFGRFPVVLVTFAFFALFPLAVWNAAGYATALGAYVIGGLREIGEPARKALITDLAPGGRDYGLYYLLRGLTVAPAALLGGWLWKFTPAAPFLIAGAVGMIGVAYYGLRGRVRT
jgi:MFS family permease